MTRVMLGVSYYRVPATLPYMLMAIPVVTLLLTWFAKCLSQPRKWVRYAEALVFAILILVPQTYGFDKKKYDLIEYDYLVRVGDWNAIIRKAEKQMPDLPMSVSATNLALAKTNQLGDRAFDFLEQLKAENNYITRLWLQVGLPIETAGDSQALIQLKKADSSIL